MLNKVLSNLKKGQTEFVEVEDGTEWGLDVRLVSKGTFAYRRTNPMVDENWEVGTADDVQSELNEVADDLDFYINN